jgi:hypothetical protein
MSSRYSVSKLANGITFISVPIKGTKATTVLAMFPVGSRYEEAKMNGCSHFVEHMMFKGTIKRPTTLDISRKLDAYGAQYNAFTSKEYTGYYVKIAGNKQTVAYDILSDMLYNSQFVKEEVKKEGGCATAGGGYRPPPMMNMGGAAGGGRQRCGEVRHRGAVLSRKPVRGQQPVSVPKLPDLPWEVWAVVGLGLALVLWKAAGKTAADAGVALGTAGAQAVGGAVPGGSWWRSGRSPSATALRRPESCGSGSALRRIVRRFPRRATRYYACRRRRGNRWPVRCKGR